MLKSKKEIKEIKDNKSMKKATIIKVILLSVLTISFIYNLSLSMLGNNFNATYVNNPDLKDGACKSKIFQSLYF